MIVVHRCSCSQGQVPYLDPFLVVEAFPDPYLDPFQAVEAFLADPYLVEVASLDPFPAVEAFLVPFLVLEASFQAEVAFLKMKMVAYPFLAVVAFPFPVEEGP